MEPRCGSECRGSELGERTGNRAERSKRRRFAWEEKPKTEDENEDDYDYDWGTRTRIDKSETTKSAIARSALPPRPLSEIVPVLVRVLVLLLGTFPMPVSSSLNRELTSAGRSPKDDRFPRAEAPLQAHHPMTLRSLRNFPLKVCGASVASQTAVSAPSSTDRVAFAPPISVRTHPGHITLTAMPSELSA